MLSTPNIFIGIKFRKENKWKIKTSGADTNKNRKRNTNICKSKCRCEIKAVIHNSYTEYPCSGLSISYKEIITFVDMPHYNFIADALC